MCDVLIYIVYHDEESKQIAEKYKAYPWAKPMYIPSTKYLESISYKILAEREEEWKEKQYVGVLKYSFEEKIPIYDFVNICQHSEADVITLVGNESHSPDVGKEASMIQSACVSHPLFPTIWSHFLMIYFKQTGTDIFSEEIPAFYSNYWIAKTHSFRSYLPFVRDMIHVMEKDTYIQNILNENALYFERIDKEKLIQIFGFPYYTYHPFILERLPCYFFWKTKAKISNITSEQRISLQNKFFEKAYPVNT
jgi:hypothetical protein